MEKNIVKLDILGVSYTIQAEEDPVHLQKVVSYLKEKVVMTKKKFNTNDSLKISLTAALNVVDELLKERNQVVSDNREIAQTMDRLIKRIDENLE